MTWHRTRFLIAEKENQLFYKTVYRLFLFNVRETRSLSTVSKTATAPNLTTVPHLENAELSL